MPLGYRQLEVIRAVARHGAVTAAAAALGVSQPAVSMMLRDCTASVGFPLFVRRQGRLRPTPELRLLLDDIERMFAGMDRINRVLDDLRDTRVGSVVVATTPALTETILPAAAIAFRRRRPGIRLSVQAMDNTAVIESAAQRQVDFGLALTPIGDPSLRAVHLCSGELVCAVPREHPLAALAELGARDLAPYPLISFSRSLPLGSLIEGSFQDAAVPLRIAIEVNQSSVALALVRSGAGIAVTDPFLLTEDRDPRIVIRRLHPARGVDAKALLPSGPLSRPALLFLATIRRCAAGLARQGVATPRGPRRAARGGEGGRAPQSS